MEWMGEWIDGWMCTQTENLIHHRHPTTVLMINATAKKISSSLVFTCISVNCRKPGRGKEKRKRRGDEEEMRWDEVGRCAEY